MHAIASSQSSPHGRHRYKVAIAIGLILAAFIAAVGTADAQTDPRRSRVVDQARTDVFVEPLRLACSPDFVNGQRGVLCQWSEATNPATRGYQLFRITNGSARELVATAGTNGRLGYFDSDVSAPSSLVYGVVAVNHARRLTGQSPAVHVQFGQDIDQIRMACAPDFVDGERGVLCRWSQSTQAGVRGYVVYRISNGEPRQAIAHVGLDGRTSYFDTDVSPGVRLTYGVTAVDGSGTVLAVGGPQHVVWPPEG